MSIPLNSQFYAFVSATQRQQVRRMQTARDQSLDAKVQQVQEQTLQEQIVELEKLQGQLRTQQARLRITGDPPLVSPGAKVLPQHIRLTMQCNGQSTTLDNFNFPVSKTFEWSAQQCAETMLEMRFQNLTLQKVFPGPYGFPDFLAAFVDGKKTFTPEDFPNQAKLMQSLGLDTLTVRWKLHDATAVLALADDVRQISQALGDQQAALRQARDLNLQQAISQATGPAQGNLIPTQIVRPCWQPVPTATLYKVDEPDAAVPPAPGPATLPAAVKATSKPADATDASKRSWFVQVGVFSSTQKAVDMLNQAGLPHRQDPLKTASSKSSQLLYAGPFANREDAVSASARIDAALALKSMVVRR